ncbi:hypothetical protein [Chromohalobacter sp.]|uniref:hypothetical protein n=1 Tax=Chromohalobacter sp. TaxID=50740 RepID=UPI001D3F4ACE|nr:hypothetical protein [Chromohalobacter sp.]NQY47224.1 hypothetical protein [Chromohalobacter sp.]
MIKKRFPILELDTCVKAQRFKVNYSVIKKNELDLVDEHVLRLLNLGSFTARDLATFFGFDARETQTALHDFISRNEVSQTQDGYLRLTQEGMKYFKGGLDDPFIKAIAEYSASLCFELIEFRPLGVDENPDNSDKGFNAITLDVPPEHVSESERHVEEKFKRMFRELLEKNMLGVNFGKYGTDIDLYMVKSVYKYSDTFLRRTETFELDSEAGRIEKCLTPKYEEPEAYTQKLHEQLRYKSGRSNIKDVIAFADSINDEFVLDLLTDGSLNIQRLAQWLVDDNREGGVIFAGGLNLTENRKKVLDAIDEALQGIDTAQQEQLPEMCLLLSSDSFNLYSKEYYSTLIEVANHQTVPGDNKARCKTTIFYPTGRRRQLPRAANFLEKQINGSVEAFEETEVLSPIEAIILEQRLAIVIYHIKDPERSDVPVPVGFITTDNDQVHVITERIRQHKYEDE